MARARIPPGTVGPVTVVPVGYDAADDTKHEMPIPRLTGPTGERMPFPKALKVGSSIKVDTADGTREFVVGRWRGLARAIDTDGSEYIVRRWRETKAAAEHATRAAGEARLNELQRLRAAAQDAAKPDTEGDRSTTVADLVRRALDSPDMQRRAPGTRAAYGYAANHIIEAPIGAMLPRDVDVATVRQFLADCAGSYGTGGTKHARAVLTHALDVAVETASLRTPLNAASAARNAIPKHRVRESGLDHKKAPTDDQVAALLSGLTRDPEARAWYPGTARRRGAFKGTRLPAGSGNPKDVADLATVLFATGGRLGEIAALRWSDFDPDAGTVMISGTLTAIAGRGTVREDRTKTVGSTRLVPLAPWARNTLLRRARRFGFDLDHPPAAPIFGSPQFPKRWRDYRNLTRSVATLFARHGIDFGRGHVGRKWRVTSLVERGVPIHKVSDLVGHASIATTQAYLGRGRQTDADVKAAL